MLHAVNGYTSNNIAAARLKAALDLTELSGNLYFGYPVLATADSKVIVDALAVTKEKGLLLFRFVSNDQRLNPEEVINEVDELSVAMENKLREYRDLRDRLKLLVPVQTIVFTTEHIPSLTDAGVIVGNSETLGSVIAQLEDFTRLEAFPVLSAVVDRVAKIKPTKKRGNVVKTDSRGFKIKEIEKRIANLDQWQRDAVISHPEGIQRIGGLAGSGKTVVLALKAAYLHASHPDWTIAVTFYTQALYQQFTDLIRRFTYEHTQDEPDWERIRVLHCWGGFSREGLCFDIARRHSLEFLDFSRAKDKYGMDNAFSGACSDLLEGLQRAQNIQHFDAILIDESQDLPQQFFEIAHLCAKPPKRIVYAFDDLQNLSDQEMAPPEQMFGKDTSGSPRVKAADVHDLLLPICYRNTPWALATAHSVGLGVYRRKGVVQMVGDKEMWQRIGYDVSGTYSAGHDISVKRRADATPSFFDRLITPAEAVVCQCFDSAKAQAEWVARQIQTDIQEQELEASDILVVLPDPKTAQKDASPIVEQLQALGIRSHLAGVTSERDEFFRANSVALAHIYRAKGNEAPMVYVVNAQYGYNYPIDLAQRRNVLFTGITRSRAWVRITGFGHEMAELEEEIKKVVENDYHLRFKMPTEKEMAQKRRLYKELTDQALARIDKAEKSVAELVKGFKAGAIKSEDLTEEFREQLRALLNDG